MSSRYDHLNREELLRLLEARDHRDATRFGLVWEANEIERDAALNSDFVTLDLVPDQCVGTAPWRNLIVEGDNFDALRYLRMAFTGQVKCILIDPPYNTGNNDFIYNDHFVTKPISSWIIPAATKKPDLDELFAEQPDSTFLMTGYTSDGTSLLREMLGNSDFPFPKPLELIQSLIAQATTGNDIVLDFFGGSGTTAHAVLAQNVEDDGDRRFILVSTTEATADDPAKNVCRDITQNRLAKAVNGYSYPAKKGLKEVPGLGGDFAYLRTHRIAAGKLLEVEHAQVWIALQLAHLDSFTAYEEKSFLWAGDEESAVCYVPRFSRDLAAALRRKVKESASVAFYSWQPHTLRQHIRDSHVTHLSVSDTLTRRFGLNLTLSPA